MKRFLLAAACVAALCSVAFAPQTARAGLFGGKAHASPTPSPTPEAMPTATPEPPNIAIPRLEAKLKADPNDRVAMADLAQEFLSIGHPEAALPLTQRLLQAGTKTAQVYYIDGSAQQSLGNMNAAVADLEAASNLEPTNLGVLGMLTDLYLKTNRTADAERVATRAVTFNKTMPQAYVALGDVYAAQQKWDQARKEFEQAFSMNPKDVSPLMAEAQTWVEQNTIPNALSVVDRAIAADPKNVQVLVFRADLFAKQRDYARAALAYDDAVAASTTDPERAAVAVRKASMYASAHQLPQAQAAFEDALRRYPAVSSVRTAYGEYWVAQKQTARAEAQFRDAIRIDKTDAAALLDLAQIKAQQGKNSEAIGYLKQLTDVAPSAEAFAMLGQAYVTAHNFTQAREACGKSFEIQRSPDTLGCIAGSDYSLKNYKEAAQIFDLLDKNVKPYLDHNAQYLYMMGVTYTHVNQSSKAVNAYKRLLKIMKPGTKEYKAIQSQIASLTKPHSSGKKSHS